MTLSFRARRALAVAFAMAPLVCMLVEPLPNGPEPDRAAWVFAVDVAAISVMVAAVVATWCGSRRAAWLAVASGAAMSVETYLCPGTGHHVFGWWTAVQWALSLSVLATGLVLVPVTRRRAEVWAALPTVGGSGHVDRPSVVLVEAERPGADVVAPRGLRASWRRTERPEPTRPATARPAAGPAGSRAAEPGQRAPR